MVQEEPSHHEDDSEGRLEDRADNTCTHDDAGDRNPATVASTEEVTSGDGVEEDSFYTREPIPTTLVCSFLETPQCLQDSATNEIRVVKCHMCAAYVPEKGLAFHIIVRHDACDVLQFEDESECVLVWRTCTMISRYI